MEEPSRIWGVSVIVPAFNEEGNIRPLVERVDLAFRATTLPYELIIVDDHSTDGTRRAIEECGRSYPVRYVPKRGVRGKAFSLWQGFAHARFALIAMIDADLQYPPEAIPEMAAQIIRGETDVVVGKRIARETSMARTAVSKGFAFVFGRILHGLTCDVQSGLKVFQRRIILEIDAMPTPWTFDLEFLTNARRAGYRIGSYDIPFAERQCGESHVDIIRASLEIGRNAIALKFRRPMPMTIKPDNERTMIGAGVVHRGRRFITHTTLNHHVSAFRTFAFWQKFAVAFLIGAVGVGIAIAWQTTAIVVMAALSAVYFIDMFFNLWLVARSMRRPPEISFADEDLRVVDNAVLPLYTVLCPLYREAEVLPHFVDAMERLDWPKDKLEVLLLLEEDDKETLETAQALHLPEYIRPIVVPHSMPKTKPKACNYGLGIARGEYLVIYDAEDIPDPQQLKKAFLGFRTLPPTVKCLQAKLNYHNARQNILTRLFTAEYSLWFDVILTGLQSVRGYIPLGGTSNHFRTADLRSLEGWDPFNVTEDCDLGARIFLHGYETAIIESVTYEEANSHLWNWIRQRSRWIKGYMQTYLVHMRHPLRYLRQNVRDGLMFQLVVGGKIMFLLVNPLLWGATASYFAFKATVGPAIEAIYPGPVFYMAVISLLFGNFMHIFYYMIGCAKRGQWSLVKYVFLVPFYWFFASIAALMAAYQLIVKPHFWEKTKHGLHLAAQKPRLADIVLRPAQPTAEAVEGSSAGIASGGGDWVPSIVIRFIPERFRGTVLSRTGMLAGALMVVNVLNFLFNAFLGRVLSFSDLALVTIVSTIWSIAAIFVGGVAATVNHRTAYLSATGGDHTSVHFLRRTMRLAGIVALVVSFAWLLAVPALSAFFRIDQRMVLFLFTPALLFGVIASAHRGFLQGKLAFGAVSAVIIAEALGKIVIAGGLVAGGRPGWTFIAIPLSLGISALAAWFFSRRLFVEGHVTSGDYHFPGQFYAASLISSVSMAMFLSVDIVLVKHFLDPVHAGQYVLLSLVGKMVFFFASLPANFVLTFVSREEGAGRDPRKVFLQSFGITAFLAAIGVVALGYFGQYIVPVLFGVKAYAILEYLGRYTVAIGLFALTSVFVVYHLARRHYVFPFASLALSLVMAVGIWMRHDTIGDIVSVIATVSGLGFFMMGALHLGERHLRFAGRALRDFVEAFVPEYQMPLPAGKRRILIFNWRDIRHVLAGGAEVYIHGMAREWAREGHQVTLFAGNDGQSPREETFDGVRIIRRGGFYFVYLWAFLYYITQFRRRYDIIIDCHNGVPFFTPLYAGEPVYCVMHHVHQEVFRQYLPRPLAAFARFLERDLMRVVYRNVKIVTVSESSRENIESLGVTRAGVEVVTPGIDLSRLAAGQKSATPMILYLGRLKAYKCVDVLITAFKVVLESTPDANLVIAGEGEERNHLERLAVQFGIEGQTHFTGRVTEDQKIQLFQNAWVLVNPSFMEGWGITTIEANACGTPVVAADVPGLRDSVRDMETGYLVPHGDTQGFAGRIIAIINDQRLRETFAERSVAWAQQFDWRVRGASFLSAITVRSDDGAPPP